MSIIIYSINMAENTRTLDNDVYKAALVHAFMNNTDTLDDMSYDIIERVLKAPHMYSDFLESIEYMSLIFLCEVEHWSFDEFNNGIVKNNNVPIWLFKCWKTYMELHNKPGWENVEDDDMEVLYYMETI